MASNYSKLDLKSFKERLTNKQYANATGARRGVGKSEMSAADKTAAYKAIDNHFGVESKPAKTGAAVKAKRVPAKRAASVKGAATKARGATPRGKRTAAKKTTSARGRKAADAEGAPALDRHNELADLHAGAEATRSAMAGLGEAATLDPTLDVKGAARQGADILQRSITRIHKILGGEPETPAHTPAPAPSTPPPADEPEKDDEEEGS